VPLLKYKLRLWSSRNDFIAQFKGGHAHWSYKTHVCTCFNFHQLRFQCINAGSVEVVAVIWRVVLPRIVAGKKKWFTGIFEKRININFCVKLGRNASCTCAMLSDVYGGEAMKRSSAFNGINSLNTVVSTWKMTKEVVVQHLTERMKMLKNCEIWCIQIEV
jgi:hypothetical protein